jgi:hypothetical protein
MRSLCEPLHFDIIITLRQLFRFSFDYLDSMYHAVLWTTVNAGTNDPGRILEPAAAGKQA